MISPEKIVNKWLIFHIYVSLPGNYRMFRSSPEISTEKSLDFTSPNLVYEKYYISITWSKIFAEVTERTVFDRG